MNFIGLYILIDFESKILYLLVTDFENLNLFDKIRVLLISNWILTLTGSLENNKFLSIHLERISV